MEENKKTKRARLVIYIPHEERMALYGLAQRARTSPAMVAKLGITQLLLRSREAEPLLPPADLKKAELVTEFGLKPSKQTRAAPKSGAPA